MLKRFNFFYSNTIICFKVSPLLNLYFTNNRINFNSTLRNTFPYVKLSKSETLNTKRLFSKFYGKFKILTNQYLFTKSNKYLL